MALEVKVTEPLVQKVVGPLAEIVGVGGAELTVTGTEIQAEAGLQADPGFLT